MSNRYIHYDLHRLVGKYFDSINFNPMVTECYNRITYKTIRRVVSDNITGFDIACYKNSYNILKKMMDNSCDSLEEDGLEYACQNGNIELVNFFIDNGANYWNQGLYSACDGGHIEIVQLMIDKGANDFEEALDRLQNEADDEDDEHKAYEIYHLVKSYYDTFC